MNTQEKRPAVNWKDPSLWAVVLGNIISIVLAYYQQWPLGQLLWVYWAQSVIIGVTNVIRIRSLKAFSTEGMRMNNRPVPETDKAKREIANFFVLHYGGFHLLYALFIWQKLPLTDVDLTLMVGLLIGASGFAGSHAYSLRHNLSRDFRDKKPNLGTLMFYPYLRIIPMHLTIIFAANIDSLGLMIFMGLKTLADAGMHIIEHYMFQAPDRDHILKD